MTKSTLSKSIIAVAIVLGVGGMGATAIHAQTVKTTLTNPMNALVSAIATKFNLNAADVQKVIDETMSTQRAEMEAKHQVQFETKLAQAVTDGRLTQVQADLIKTKATELKASFEVNRTADQSLTNEQRKAKMEERRTALETWATSNNIPTEYLRFVGGGKGMGGGPGGHGGFGPRPDQITTTPTQ